MSDLNWTLFCEPMRSMFSLVCWSWIRSEVIEFELSFKRWDMEKGFLCLSKTSMKWFSDRFTCKRCTQTGIWFLKPFERFYASTIDFARRHVKIFRSLDKDDVLCQYGPLYFKCKLSGSISLIHFGQFQTQNLRRIVHIPLLRWVPSNQVSPGQQGVWDYRF